MERAAFCKGVLDGVNVLVCLDGWIRPIIIGRGHEAYFAANPPGSQEGRVDKLRYSCRPEVQVTYFFGQGIT